MMVAPMLLELGTDGQKVWTSGGHYAKRAILVARTDPSVSKHRER